MQSRREFLKQSAVVSMAPTLPAFLRKSASATDPGGEKILVVIQLSGGNDGLNTVVPYRDDLYYANRQELKLSQDSVIRLDDFAALHPSMRDMADLYQKGSLAIVQGVGYPDANRSHDVSMAIWHTAKTDPESHRDAGWLGRCLDRKESRPRVPSVVVTAADETPQAVRGRKCQVANIDSLDEFRFASVPKQNDSINRAILNDSPSPMKSQATLVEFMRQTAIESQWTVEQIRSVAGPDSRPRNTLLDRLGNSFAKQMSVIAELIRADFGSTVYYAAQSGYDTHSIQRNRHSELLGALSTAIGAFMKDLETSGHADRVLVMCFSEFGRQVQENASVGTDHGTSGPMFLVGKGVRGGLHGTAPDLSKLVDNAPLHTTDFRDVYAGILKGWLQVDPGQVLDGHLSLANVLL